MVIHTWNGLKDDLESFFSEHGAGLTSANFRCSGTHARYGMMKVLKLDSDPDHLDIGIPKGGLIEDLDISRIPNPGCYASLPRNQDCYAKESPYYFANSVGCSLDAEHRDFSINALYLNALDGTLLDPTGGLDAAIFRTPTSLCSRDSNVIWNDIGGQLRFFKMLKKGIPIASNDKELVWLCLKNRVILLESYCLEIINKKDANIQTLEANRMEVEERLPKKARLSRIHFMDVEVDEISDDEVAERKNEVELFFWKFYHKLLHGDKTMRATIKDLWKLDKENTEIQKFWTELEGLAKLALTINVFDNATKTNNSCRYRWTVELLTAYTGFSYFLILTN